MRSREDPSFCLVDRFVKPELSAATKCTLPHGEATPAELSKLPYPSAVAETVASNLFLPKIPARCWQSIQMAIVAMPEAAMNKDRRFVFWKNEVGSAWNVGMKPVPESPPVKSNPKVALRFGIRSANPGHHPAARCRIDDICHSAATRCCGLRGSSGSRLLFQSMILRSAGAMCCATAVATGTTTELPNCL